MSHRITSPHHIGVRQRNPIARLNHVLSRLRNVRSPLSTPHLASSSHCLRIDYAHQVNTPLHTAHYCRIGSWVCVDRSLRIASTDVIGIAELTLFPCRLPAFINDSNPHQLIHLNLYTLQSITHHSPIKPSPIPSPPCTLHASAAPIRTLAPLNPPSPIPPPKIHVAHY
jgi:hypothetical protein